MKLPESVEAGAPIVALVDIDLESLQMHRKLDGRPDGFEGIVTRRGSNLYFLVVDEWGTIRSTECDPSLEPRGAPIRATRGGVLRSRKRLDLCFDFAPGEYWIAAFHEALSPLQITPYHRLTVLPEPTPRCFDPFGRRASSAARGARCHSPALRADLMRLSFGLAGRARARRVLEYVEARVPSAMAAQRLPIEPQ